MSSESEEEYAATRYVNKKVRTTIEVEITDLVTAGYVVKDNPASTSALEDSLAIDLDQAAKKLLEAKEKQDKLQAYMDIAKDVKEGKLIKIQSLVKNSTVLTKIQAKSRLTTTSRITNMSRKWSTLR